MANQGLGVSETDGQGCELHLVHHARTGFETAAQLETDHAAITAHLLASDGVLRMAFEPRIAYPLDLWVVFEKTGKLERALALPLDAQRIGMHAEHDEPGVEGTYRTAQITQRTIAHAVDKGRRAD